MAFLADCFYTYYSYVLFICNIAFWGWSKAFNVLYFPPPILALIQFPHNTEGGRQPGIILQEKLLISSARNQPIFCRHLPSLQILTHGL